MNEPVVTRLPNGDYAISKNDGLIVVSWAEARELADALVKACNTVAKEAT